MSARRGRGGEGRQPRGSLGPARPLARVGVAGAAVADSSPREPRGPGPARPEGGLPRPEERGKERGGHLAWPRELGGGGSGRDRPLSAAWQRLACLGRPRARGSGTRAPA